MKTVNITLYEFHELNETARHRAMITDGELKTYLDNASQSYIDDARDILLRLEKIMQNHYIGRCIGRMRDEYTHYRRYMSKTGQMRISHIQQVCEGKNVIEDIVLDALNLCYRESFNNTNMTVEMMRHRVIDAVRTYILSAETDYDKISNFVKEKHLLFTKDGIPIPSAVISKSRQINIRAF